MEKQGTSVDSIVTRVRRYLDSENGEGEDALEAFIFGRVHSVMLLLAHRFPEHLIHEVVWCSEEEAGALVDAIRRYLPGAGALRDFLAGRDPETFGRPRSIEESDSDVPALGESEDAKQALDMLEYWTDRWLQEYNDAPFGDGKAG